MQMRLMIEDKRMDSIESPQVPQMEGHFLPHYFNEVGRTMVFLKADEQEL